MELNTIILIDKNPEEKNFFIEKLKKKIKFSYTKLEAVLQTIKEISEIKNYTFESNKYIEFLNKFLDNIAKKDGMYLLDIDNLSVQNANKLIAKHNNILIIYLQKIQNEEKIISIDINNNTEIEKLIEEIVKRKKV